MSQSRFERAIKKHKLESDRPFDWYRVHHAIYKLFLPKHTGRLAILVCSRIIPNNADSHLISDSRPGSGVQDSRKEGTVGSSESGLPD